MPKIIHLHLPDNLAEKIKMIADRKGLGVSTAVREIVCEHLNAPVQPAKNEAASTPVKDVPA